MTVATSNWPISKVKTPTITARDYLNHHNGSPKPYVWTKTAAEIFSKVARAKQALVSQH